MKTRRENIIAAIEFGTPDRLPLVFDAFGVSDVHNVGWNQIGTGDHEKKLTFDEWHCGWSRRNDRVAPGRTLVNEAGERSGCDSSLRSSSAAPSGR